jgi:HK97 family phage portal protein
MSGLKYKILDALGLQTKALDATTFPFDLLGLPVLSGVSVTPQSALSVPSVSAAVALISSAIGTLPLEIFREENGGKISATEHPAYELVFSQANEWTSSSDFRRQLATDALLYGDGFAVATRLQSGEVYELIRLQPGSVTVLYDSVTGEPVYKHQPQSGGASTLDGRAQVSAVSHDPERTYSWRDVIHVTSPISVNGITGVSPVQAAREAIGLALVMEQYAARLFGNGARPGGALKVPPNIPPKHRDEILARMHASWVAAHAGSNSGGTAILEEGTEFQQLALSSVDAQFLELRSFAVTEIARAFGVSPVMIGDASRATWSNAEQYNLQFLTYTLAPWLRNFEGAYRRVMIPYEQRKEGYSVEFDASDLLRGDATTRGEYIAKMRTAGVMSANEARAIEQLPRHKDGDTLESPHVQSPGKSGDAPQKEAA